MNSQEDVVEIRYRPSRMVVFDVILTIWYVYLTFWFIFLVFSQFKEQEFSSLLITIGFQSVISIVMIDIV